MSNSFQDVDIVYSASINGNMELLGISTKDRKHYRLTNTDYDETFPVWSPNGEKIAFLADLSNGLGIYILPAPNGKPYIAVNATTEPVAWSRDGSHVIYTRTTEKDKPRIVIRNIKTQIDTVLNAGHPTDGYATWSPTEEVIVFESARDGNSNIYRMDVSGKKLRQLTNDATLQNWAAWFPDGTQIAYGQGHEETKELWVMNKDGGKKRFVTAGMYGDAYPEWSTDGKYILLTRQEDNEVTYIYQVDVTTGEDTKVAKGTAPSWKR